MKRVSYPSAQQERNATAYGKLARQSGLKLRDNPYGQAMGMTMDVIKQEALGKLAGLWEKGWRTSAADKPVTREFVDRWSGIVGQRIK